MENYTCGNTDLVIDGSLINFISTLILVIQVVVPILLIIFGMLDLGKAVMAQKEDEIKKGQTTFIKRLIAAAIVFFVVVIVKVVVSLVASGSEEESVVSCIDCFIRGTEYCN